MKNVSYSAVKLIKTNKYNTYQFFGVMANKNINLTDGLKFAALSCYKWLRERLDNSNVPKELDFPDPSEYKKVKSEDFKSFYINDSFTIAVEVNIDDGIFSLRVIENDLGALKESEIVPGRIIQSDIAFRIVEEKLECGFKTKVSDASDVEKAGCVRYKLIKELSQNVLFGLLHNNRNIYNPNNMIITKQNIDNLKLLIKSCENQMPFILYAYDDHKINDIDHIEIPKFSPIQRSTELLEKLQLNQNNTVDNRIVPYANRNLGYAWCYFLPKSLFGVFSSFINLNHIDINDVIVIEPAKQLNKVTRYNYVDKDKYQNHINNYGRDKDIDFNDILFVDEAKTIIERTNQKYLFANSKLLDEAQEKIEQYKAQLARETRKSEYVNTTDNKEELIRAYEQIEKSQKENKTLNNEINRLKKELRNKNDYIDYIHRKETRPKYHEDIEKWADQFSNIILDKKAIVCLNKNDAENVDVDVICDALDYLDKAYSKYLFENLSLDELNTISANIYNRPYNVTPSGIPVSAKGDCKVKYAFVNENRIEHILDQHLKIGGHGELLRIYFIVDKERKKIVIGSLPNHLEY